MADKTSRQKGSMTEGSPIKCMLVFAIPMILGNMFQQLYNMMDSIIVGNMIDKNALAAVGASTSITMLFVMVAIGTGIGCSVVISQLFGAEKLAQMKTAVSTALFSIVVFSVILSIIGRLLSGPILTLMGTPTEFYEDAKIYLDIYFYGFFFLFLYNAFSAVFNALGDSKKPLIFLVFSSVLNVGLDILLVKRMGIAGAAWATLIAQAVSAAISFVVLAIKLHRIKCGAYKKFSWNMLFNMTKVAVPTILQQSMISIGMMLIQTSVNSFGPDFVAGYTAAVKIDGMAIVPMVNAGNATSTFVAQNIGAGETERVKKGYHVGLVMAISIGVLVGVIFQFFGADLIGMFMDSKEDLVAIGIGAKYISIVSIFYFVMGMMNVTNSVLRGAADIKWFMSITIIILVVRVALTYAFAQPTDGLAIMWANPVGWSVGLLIGFIRYKQGGWKKIKIV